MNGAVMIIVTVAVLAVIGLLTGLLLVKAGEKFEVETDPREAAVRECLPGNNCGACGFPGCDGLAAAIVSGEAKTNGCPVGGAAVGEKVALIMGVEAEGLTDKKVAFVRCGGTCDKAKRKSTYIGIRSCEAAAAAPGKGEMFCAQGCIGYGDCVRVCRFDAIHVVDGVAVVDRTKCVSCGLCAAACPQRLIDLVPLAASPYTVQCSNTERFPIQKTQCDAGCRGCGVCAKNCPSGAIQMENNLARIDYSKCTGCGTCAQKCPAGCISFHDIPVAEPESKVS